MAGRIDLPCPVHTDEAIFSALPRYTLDLLGRSYDVKRKEMSGAYVIQNAAQLVSGPVKLPSQHIQIDHVDSLDKLDEMLTAGGEMGFSFDMIEVRGKGLYENSCDRRNRSLTLFQRGFKGLFQRSLDTGLLQSGDDYLLGRRLHDGLNQTPEMAQDFLSSNGHHYITAMYWGCSGCRKVTLTFKSARERKKIEAEVNGKIGKGKFNLDFKGKFDMEDKENSEHFDVKVVSVALGGVPKHLDVMIAKEDIEEDLAGKLDKSFNEFLDSVDTDNAAVIRASADPVDRTILKIFNLSPAQQENLDCNVKSARRRRETLLKWSLELDLRKARFYDHAATLDIGTGCARHLISDYEEVVKAFKECHIDVVRKELMQYLMKPMVELAVGEGPSLGTSREPTQFDMGCGDADKLRKTPLGEGDMDKLYQDLTHGNLALLELDQGKNVAMWDGPTALGKPCGLPNEVRFYHRDVDRQALKDGTKDQKGVVKSYKFKVKGEDWDPSTHALIVDDDLFLEAVPQNSEDDAIDFGKLPGYFQDIKYSGKKVYRGGAVTYVGDWRGSRRHGAGKFEYRDQDKLVVELQSHDDNIRGRVKITFAEMGTDARKSFHGNATIDRETLSISMCGPGKLVMSDGTELEWQFKSDRAIVNNRDEYYKLPLWFRENVCEHVALRVEEELLAADGAGESVNLEKALEQAEAWLKHSPHSRLETTIGKIRARMLEEPAELKSLLQPRGLGQFTMAVAARCKGNVQDLLTIEDDAVVILGIGAGMKKEQWREFKAIVADERQRREQRPSLGALLAAEFQKLDGRAIKGHTEVAVNLAILAPHLFDIVVPDAFVDNAINKELVVLLLGTDVGGPEGQLDTMLNYVVGVKFSEDARLALPKDTATNVSAFRVPVLKGGPVEAAVTFILVPGSMDLERLEDFLSERAVRERLQFISCCCLVMPSSTSRLTAPAEKALRRIKDIAGTGRVALFCTSADAAEPPCRKACEGAGLSCSVYKQNSEVVLNSARDELSRMLWDRTMAEMKCFFARLAQSRPLQMPARSPASQP